MKSLKLMIFGLVLALASVCFSTITLGADYSVFPILALVFLVAGIVVTAVGLFMKDRKDGDGKKEEPKDRENQ